MSIQKLGIGTRRYSTLIRRFVLASLIVLSASGCTSFHDITLTNPESLNSPISDKSAPTVQLVIAPDITGLTHSTRATGSSCEYKLTNIGPTIGSSLVSLTSRYFSVDENQHNRGAPTIAYQLIGFTQEITLSHSLGSGSIRAESELKLQLVITDSNGEKIHTSIVEGDDSTSKSFGAAFCTDGIALLQETSENAISEAMQQISNTIGNVSIH